MLSIMRKHKFVYLNVYQRSRVRPQATDGRGCLRYRLAVIQSPDVHEFMRAKMRSS